MTLHQYAVASGACVPISFSRDILKRLQAVLHTRERSSNLAKGVESEVLRRHTWFCDSTTSLVERIWSMSGTCNFWHRRKLQRRRPARPISLSLLHWMSFAASLILAVRWHQFCKIHSDNDQGHILARSLYGLSWQKLCWSLGAATFKERKQRKDYSQLVWRPSNMLISHIFNVHVISCSVLAVTQKFVPPTSLRTLPQISKIWKCLIKISLQAGMVAGDMEEAASIYSAYPSQSKVTVTGALANTRASVGAAK